MTQTPNYLMLDRTNLRCINSCPQKPEWLGIMGNFTPNVSKFTILLRVVNKLNFHSPYCDFIISNKIS